MAGIRFWNFMGAVGGTYFCFYNYDKYLEWAAGNKREWDAKNHQLLRAKQHALDLMKESGQH